MQRGLLASLGFVALAGCLSPYDQCVSKAGAEVRQIQAGIDTANENLARGYAVHSTEEPFVVVETCFAQNVAPYPCTEVVYRTVETPVAIDAGLEKEKLAALKARLKAAQRRFRTKLKACEGLDGA